MEKRPHLIPSLIAAVMLLGALVDWPYGYYQLLRFVVFGAAGYIVYLIYDWNDWKKIWIEHDRNLGEDFDRASKGS